MTLDDLLQNQPDPSYNYCKFRPWLETLGRDDQDAIHRAFDNPGITTRHIFRILESIGCPVRESAVRTHRLGQCRYCATMDKQQ